MEEYRVKQIQPNHADHISCYRDEYLDEMFENESVVAQLKYDGERMLVHIDNGNVYCTSRRYSKKTNRFMENQDRLPYLKEYIANLDDNLKELLGYTVIDCECYAKNWSEAASVLHSLPERAKELQDNGIDIKYSVFDCLFYRGIDLRSEPYWKRLRYAINIIELLNYPKIHLVKFVDDNNDVVNLCHAQISNFVKSKKDWQARMQTAIYHGFEGIVLKSLYRSYYDKAALLKCKKFETVDTVVIDKQQGTGKYANTVGALIVGYYDPDKNEFVRVSKVNCGTDADRDWWRDNWETAKYSVLEVKCQEITGKSLRHPVYIRIRNDKSYLMCTKDTIFKEEE